MDDKGRSMDKKIFITHKMSVENVLLENWKK